MLEPRKRELIEGLRARVAAVEYAGRHRDLLPFGIGAIDRHLRGGLAAGSLHEVAPGRPCLADEAAATIFVAGVLARARGPVLWCLRHRDLFAPALARVGLHPMRVVVLEAGRDEGVLLAMEEGLRHGGLAGVVGEVRRLPLAASRRLKLAAESSGVTAFCLRRWVRGSAIAESTASETRWAVTSRPTAPLGVPGLPRARWRLDLLRARGAEPYSWDVEAPDAQGRLALAADLADRSAEAAAGRAAA
jgi:protein ImuA